MRDIESNGPLYISREYYWLSQDLSTSQYDWNMYKAFGNKLDKSTAISKLEFMKDMIDDLIARIRNSQ